MKWLSPICVAMTLIASSLTTSAVTAATPVSVPQFSNGFLLGVTGYSLRPSEDNGALQYGFVNEEVLQQIKPGYHWGYGLNAAYLIPCTAIDIGVSYFHFDHDYYNNVNDALGAFVPYGNAFNFPLVDPITLDPFEIINADAHANYAFDVADLTLGQYFDVGCRFRIHPYLLLRWCQIERDLRTRFTQATTIDTTQTIVQTQNTDFIDNSRFQGVGPGMGVDAHYCLGCGFGIVEHLDTALVVGNARRNSREAVEQIITIPGSTSETVFADAAFPSYNRNRVVPVIDLKLGVDYSFALNCCPCWCTAFTVEAGWSFSQYFNPLDRLTTNTILQNTGEGGDTIPLIASAVPTGNFVSDVGLNGPYLSFVFRM